MKVYVNQEGLFLQISEVSSHSPTPVHHAHWGELNKATGFPDTHKKTDIAWKGNAPLIVAEMQAVETRIVTLDRQIVE